MPGFFLFPVVAHAAPDPLAREYDPPRVREVGATAGQVRVVATVGAGIQNGLHLAGLGTLEFMTIPWVGLRMSSLLTIPLNTGSSGTGAQLWVFRMGPSLHLLPHKRVDLSLLFDGGVALVDIGKDTRTVMPAISPGAAFDVWLSSAFFLRFEGTIDIGIADRANAARVYVTPLGFFGLGIGL